MRRKPFLPPGLTSLAVGDHCQQLLGNLCQRAVGFYFRIERLALTSDLPGTLPAAGSIRFSVLW